MTPVDAAIQSIGKMINSFHPSQMPALSRSSYRRELTAWLFLPVMMGAVEGSMVGVLVKNGYAGRMDEKILNYAVAVLSAAPAISNITSFLWTWLSHGRHKIRFLTAVQLLAVALVGSIAFAPQNGIGLAMILLGVIGSRVCWAAVATLRSTVWRVNYPDTDRARVTGKFATVQAIMLAIVGTIIAGATEHSFDAIRFAYPIAAFSGLIGTLIYSRMRVRGHRALIRAELAQARHERPSFNPHSLWRVLRQDRDYRKFMTFQFLFGLGNIMTMPLLVVVLRDRFHMGELAGVVITTTIPLAVMTASVPMWAKYLDRVHIIQFRAVHSWAFIGIEALVLIASLNLMPELLYLAAVIRGIALGGGALAWNLGHHYFATPEQSSAYMGVHVTLTGVRGLIAPFLGVLIYNQLREIDPSNETLGSWAFAVCMGISLTGVVGFLFMARAMAVKKTGIHDA